jgi:hypothetical protein
MSTTGPHPRGTRRTIRSDRRRRTESPRTSAWRSTDRSYSAASSNAGSKSGEGASGAQSWTAHWNFKPPHHGRRPCERPRRRLGVGSSEGNTHSRIGRPAEFSVVAVGGQVSLVSVREREVPASKSVASMAVGSSGCGNSLPAASLSDPRSARLSRCGTRWIGSRRGFEAHSVSPRSFVP